MRQVAERWWPEDGDEADLAAFCEESFVADPGELARTFAQLEARMEQIDGHVLEVRREVMMPGRGLQVLRVGKRTPKLLRFSLP